jgi:hypothetical protein
MANKLSSTETSATDAAADEETLRPRMSTTKNKGGRGKSEPTKRKKVADAATQKLGPPKSATPKAIKADLILKKLRTAKGASINMLIADTGWQAHSVRGFLSAVVKKKLALNLVSEVGKDGVRRYRIDGDTKSA